ncbi:anthranilate phosphoribosyltransferase [Aneurinibacillus soli]|uniref:Anthranilate phosphoribosyltransferase n=1 Tax=Aneurinibacillus soli TaxID=1500254 RepID=A0A0U4WK42_9BACL|nr:anthranilate phosphoribosyltransferase [Aneurinibacillus soli]PYE63052.1 anthranilate phosphoribosyltransferase [Aneurinibacillus soli]BAU28889.1 Anthranilate phosphoribosyltransferase [Aneurinibacillus soli]
MIKQVLEQVMRGESLSSTNAQVAMESIMSGEVPPARIAAFLTALRIKGETVSEIIGFARAMRGKAISFPNMGEGLVDTCGTGGDGGISFNISTAAALVAAAGGARVAKHGNRAVSSKSGSADVLEALGVTITGTPEAAAECLKKTDVCFLFAPTYHTAMKYAAGVRRELGIRTVFNLLGPLTNPAGADRQLMGVYDRQMGESAARALCELGVQHALVVTGADGLDEISISGPTHVVEVSGGEVISRIIHPEEFGLPVYPIEAVAGGGAKANAEIIQRILAGERGAYRDIVVLNAGAALYVSNRAASIHEGVALASELLDSGRVQQKLEQIIQVTGGVSHAS